MSKERLVTYVSPEEGQRIRDAATQSGRSVAGFLRHYGLWHAGMILENPPIHDRAAVERRKEAKSG